MILKIRKYGDKVLRNKSTAVEKIDDEILKILDDMVDTMKDAQGVGLAAPQVGVNKTMFVVEVGDGKIRKVINPEFIEYSAEIVDRKSVV